MACAAVVLVVSETAEATFPGKNGRIAYSGYDGNDYEIYTIRTDGTGLLLDTYHLLRMGRDPAAQAMRWADAIGHVHVADAPGRRAPGTGQLDLPAFLAALADAGYDGPVGLEYDAAGDTPGSLGFLRAFPG